MKTQRRLRLRQAGKHHLPHTAKGRYAGLARYGLAYNLSMAIQMNCVPKHSDEELQLPYYTMDYVTGVHTWHGLVHLYGAEDADSYTWQPQTTFIGYTTTPDYPQLTSETP